MKDIEKEIAKRYMLPERPFVYGMASAFDLFGVMNQGKNEQLLTNLQKDFEKRDRDALRSAWAKVGQTLYWAMLEYEKAAGESSNQ